MVFFQDGICDEISYTVSRLVQGLSSHRKFARLGYSVALCQVKKDIFIVQSQFSHNQIKTDETFFLINNVKKKSVSKVHTQ